MPHEADRHLRTWMAFGANPQFLDQNLLPMMQRDIANIALAIAEFEPVVMLVRECDYRRAKQLMGSAVELLVSSLDDLWMRDTGPVFVTTAQGEKAAIDFNFNGWGGKQTHDADMKIAKWVADHAGVDLINTNLVLEGGGLEVDGQGTAILTESCLLNPNRNFNIAKTDFELELKRLLGLEKIIWLPGIKDHDITDGHIDFFVRFVEPGRVLASYDSSYNHAITTKHIDILRSTSDCQNKTLDVVTLENPSIDCSNINIAPLAHSYMGFYVCNGAIISQKFGDSRTDFAAKNALQMAFPDREIIQLIVEGISLGGGSIHCTTQQEVWG